MNKFKIIVYDWWVYFLIVLLAFAAMYYFGSAYYIAFDEHLFPVPAVPNASAVAERADWGVMGDFFGGMLNPAFSFLGLVLLLLTLRENKKALSLSQEELKKSNEALQNQSSTLDKQRFEDTFFSMLDQLNNALDKVYAERERTLFDKKLISSPIGNLKRNLKDIFTKINQADYFKDGKPDANTMIFDLKACVLNEQEISRLFRVLYQMLKFIAHNQPDSALNGKFNLIGQLDLAVTSSEKMYSNMIRALLPTDMYLYLAINCLCVDSEDDYFKYKCLIERYAFLEHMSITERLENNMVVSCSDHMKFILNNYSASAFGKSKEYKEYCKFEPCRAG